MSDPNLHPLFQQIMEPFMPKADQTNEALCLLDKIAYGHANALSQSAARLIVAELDRRLSAMRAGSPELASGDAP